MTGGILLGACLGRIVTDPGGRPLGRVADLEMEAAERFPRVTALEVRSGRDRTRIAWARIERLDAGGVTVRAAAPSGEPLRDGRRLLLARDVLDAQVVDLAGRRLARVGDVELAWDGDALRAVAVDVGLAPIARRLGLRRIAGRLREDWIGWDGVYLASGRGHRVQLEQRAADVHRFGHEELMALVAHLPPARGAELLDVARPGEHPDPVATARRVRRPRRRFRVMHARKRAPS